MDLYIWIFNGIMSTNVFINIIYMRIRIYINQPINLYVQHTYRIMWVMIAYINFSLHNTKKALTIPSFFSIKKIPVFLMSFRREKKKVVNDASKFLLILFRGIFQWYISSTNIINVIICTKNNNNEIFTYHTVDCL